MSEKQNLDQEQPRPAVSPDQKKVFGRVYAQLTRFTSQYGEPHMVTYHYKYGVSHFDKQLAEMNHEEFSHDANGLEATCYAADGTERPGWVYVNDESGANTSGYLATVSFQKSPLDYDQDIYTFFPDGNVGYEKYLNDNDETTFDHWLTADEIEEFGILLETTEPGWLPRSLPEAS